MLTAHHPSESLDDVPDGRRAECRRWIESSWVSAQRGDRSPSWTWFVRGVDRLFAILRRILRDVDRTEDAVQDALVIAWRDLPGLRDPDRFDAWLYRLLVRSCVAEAKRERRLGATIRLLPMELPGSSDDYVSVVVRDELDRGFRRLSPE